MLVVEDTHLDPRFAENPLVTGEFGLRFYAGAPLLTPEGRAIGSLCLLDFAGAFLFPRSAASAAGLCCRGHLRDGAAPRTRSSQESERLSRQMFAESPLPMWVFDTEISGF